MLGIIVHGDNHFIVRGPLPSRLQAEALVDHWSVIQIGATTTPELAQWRISTKEFREDLQWAILVQTEGALTPAVKQLLQELRSRGVHIHDNETNSW
jgi:hypothetical protein